mgnify:CR=1 FL=1
MRPGPDSVRGRDQVPSADSCAIWTSTEVGLRSACQTTTARPDASTPTAGARAVTPADETYRIAAQSSASVVVPIRAV